MIALASSNLTQNLKNSPAASSGIMVMLLVASLRQNQTICPQGASLEVRHSQVYTPQLVVAHTRLFVSPAYMRLVLVA